MINLSIKKTKKNVPQVAHLLALEEHPKSQKPKAKKAIIGYYNVMGSCGFGSRTKSISNRCRNRVP